MFVLLCCPFMNGLGRRRSLVRRPDSCVSVSALSTYTAASLLCERIEFARCERIRRASISCAMRRSARRTPSRTPSRNSDKDDYVPANATGGNNSDAYHDARPCSPRIQIGGVTDFGKRGSEADFTPPDLPLQIKICPSQRFYLGRSEKTVSWRWRRG